MQRQSIIILLKITGPGDEVTETEAWGNLKKACKNHGWNYSTMSKKKLPQEKDEWLIQRVPFN